MQLYYQELPAEMRQRGFQKPNGKYYAGNTGRTLRQRSLVEKRNLYKVVTVTASVAAAVETNQPQLKASTEHDSRNDFMPEEADFAGFFFLT